MGNQGITVPSGIPIRQADFSRLDEESGDVINTVDILHKVIEDNANFFMFPVYIVRQYIKDMQNITCGQLGGIWGMNDAQLLEMGTTNAIYSPDFDKLLKALIVEQAVVRVYHGAEEMNLSEFFEVTTDDGSLVVNEHFGHMLMSTYFPTPEDTNVNYTYIVRNLAEQVWDNDLQHRKTISIRDAMFDLQQAIFGAGVYMLDQIHKYNEYKRILRPYIGNYFNVINTYLRDPELYFQTYGRIDVVFFYYPEFLDPLVNHLADVAKKMRQTNGMVPVFGIEDVVEQIDHLYMMPDSPRAPRGLQVVRCIRANIIQDWRKYFGMDECDSFQCVEDFLMFLRGKTIVEKSYLSTGLFPLDTFCAREGFETILMILRVEQGSPYLFPFTCETEILFPRNTRTSITDVQYREIPYVGERRASKRGIVITGVLDSRPIRY